MLQLKRILSSLLLCLTYSSLVNAGNSNHIGTPVSIKWGLSDTSAVVGKYFSYSIPPDAFKGDVQNFEVSEAGGDHLPDWLSFDNNIQQFFGVPGPWDMGPHHIIVTAVGSPLNKTHSSIAKDIFTIHVREDSEGNKGKHALLPAKKDVMKTEKGCAAEETIITLSILLDVDLHKLTPAERSEILYSGAEILEMNVNRLRLLPLDYAHSMRHEALMAGPSANGGEEQHSREGTYLSWKIGCGNKLTNELAREVARIEKESARGYLSARLGYAVLSWQVVSGSLKPNKRRRQSGNITPTPTYRPTPYTRTPEIETRPITHDWEEHRTTERQRPTTSTTTTTARVTRQPTTSTTRRRPPPTTPTLPPSTRRADYPPRLIKNMTRITCKRDEDGGTYNLTLQIRPTDHRPGHGDFVFGKALQHIFGLTMRSGTREYEIIASDHRHQKAATKFWVQTVELPGSEEPTHQFTARIQTDHDEFMRNTEEKIRFFRKLVSFYGDKDYSAIYVRKFSRGSTLITWTNNTLSGSTCDHDAVAKIQERMFNPDDSIRVSFERHMRPFEIVDVAFQLEGPCLMEEKEARPTSPEVPPTDKGRPDTTEESDTITPSLSGTENLLISTIVPVLIILLLLLLAILIACILYKRNRKNKAAKQDGVRNPYVSKGTPVIFPDEVGPGEREPLATSPLLIKEERAPLQSPDPTIHRETSTFNGHRQQSPSSRPSEAHEMAEHSTFIGGNGVGGNGHTGGRSSTPKMTTTENPLYRPPPPIGELSVTRSPRPKHTLPHQREPPPYVPP